MQIQHIPSKEKRPFYGPIKTYIQHEPRHVGNSPNINNQSLIITNQFHPTSWWLILIESGADDFSCYVMYIFWHIYFSREGFMQKKYLNFARPSRHVHTRSLALGVFRKCWSPPPSLIDSTKFPCIHCFNNNPAITISNFSVP